MPVGYTGVPEWDDQRTYFFDRAIWLFGSALEQDIETATKKIKRESSRESKQALVMARWMNDGTTDGTRGRFRDPAAKRG